MGSVFLVLCQSREARLGEVEGLPKVTWPASGIESSPCPSDPNLGSVPSLTVNLARHMAGALQDLSTVLASFHGWEQLR